MKAWTTLSIYCFQCPINGTNPLSLQRRVMPKNIQGGSLDFWGVSLEYPIWEFWLSKMNLSQKSPGSNGGSFTKIPKRAQGSSWDSKGIKQINAKVHLLGTFMIFPKRTQRSEWDCFMNFPKRTQFIYWMLAAEHHHKSKL